jgi:hypothetical protein
MLNTVFTSSLLAALAAAAPQYAVSSPAQVPGYTNGDASFSVVDPTGTPATVFGPDSQVPVSHSRWTITNPMLTIQGYRHHSTFCPTTKKLHSGWTNQPWTICRHPYHHWCSKGASHTRYCDCSVTPESHCHLLQHQWSSPEPHADSLHPGWWSWNQWH